jgi:ABC-type nitrate/sulfonate/bicarbonate transport system substrate-binding protein
MIWLLALVFLIGTSWPSWAAEPGRIRASYASFSPASALLSLTQEAGHFKRENLDVEILYVPAGSLTLQALMAKEIQLSTGWSGCRSSGDSRCRSGLYSVNG